MSGVERSRIDSEKNFCGVLDKVHELTCEDLFKGAPEFFDCVMMNPPFGGKEGKEAQTNFDYETGATQVLFLQHGKDREADAALARLRTLIA